MIKVLFDTNVILDIALEREPFVKHSLQTVHLIGIKVEGYLSALTLVNTFYFARKQVGIEQAKEFINDLLKQFEVLNTTKEVCIEALNSDFKDFEDAVQEFSAFNSGLEIIVTRNTKDFKNSRLQVFEPRELIDFFK